jgi:hypothetical protein
VSPNTRYHPFFKSDWRNITKCLHITNCHI